MDKNYKTIEKTCSLDNDFKGVEEIGGDKMTKERTLVYTKDGDDYRGYFDSKSLTEWKKYGRKNKMKYLYKGHRYGTHFSGEGTEPVCVFSNKN